MRPARNHGGCHHGRDGRSPLALAAALAVAVPGLLVSACSSQSGTGPAGGDAVSAAGRAVAAGKAPVAARRPAAVQAVRLLAQAAQAAIVTSYQGQEIVTRWSQGGGSVLVSSIWHVSGGQTVTQTTADGASLSSQSYLSSDTDGQSPEGVLGVTAPLVQLLESHYVVAYAGTGSADNRTAQVVEASRADGSIAARFWLDDATKLPLEREVFDTAAHVIGQDVFIAVSFTAPGEVAPAAAGGKASSVVPPQGGSGGMGPPGERASRASAGSPQQAPAASASARVSAAPRTPWTDPLSRRQLLALRSRGWLVPAALPGGLSLFTGAETQADTGAVLDLGYSDGLSMVSVFEQRGKLPARLPGWRKIKTGGHVVFTLPDQRSLTWSGHGMVFTMMADAPSASVNAAVGALPHDGPTGFWKRMSRGLVRVASWVNPFH
jgi:sigma-E factor negative regulatory protein RseB